MLYVRNAGVLKVKFQVSIPNVTIVSMGALYLQY